MSKNLMKVYSAKKFFHAFAMRELRKFELRRRIKRKRKPPQRLKVLDEVEAAASLAVWSATIGGALHYDLSPAYSL